MKIPLDEAYKRAEKGLDPAEGDEENVRRVMLRTALRKHAFGILPRLVETLEFVKKHAVFSVGAIRHFGHNPWDDINKLLEEARSVEVPE